MTKKLRLAVAELTDVGRKRERNQDNVGHQIPKDEETLHRRGALFVVCDGMGGHAAGEVASQMAIKSIRDGYYGAHEPTIVGALAHAVERANADIFGHAREHPELAGMGTTCVAAVLADGRAYVVNVGDSRAYLVRNGKMTQITQDHSWVAEQVRVGILTEEQARHHSHRNVITRSLGTQPSVTADLFIENLHDGDRLLLCSDGLHGYVEEAEIAREMVNEATAEDTAHTLIAMANANGGPDNITAVVVHLLEVPEPTGEIVLPPSVAAAAQAAGIPKSSATAPLPIVTAPVPAVGHATTTSGVAARQSPTGSPAGKPTRRGRTLIYLLEIAALLALAVGAWWYFFGPHAASQLAAQHLSSDLAHARATVAQANTQDPVTALGNLARDRQQLLTDLGASDLTAAQREQVQTELATQIQPAIQTAIQHYNADALFRLVPGPSVVSYDNSTGACTPPGATGPQPLKSVAGLQQLTSPPAKSGTTAPASRFLFALNSGVVYELITPVDGNSAPAAGGVRCAQVVPQGFASTSAISADGTTLDLLSQRADGSYAVVVVNAQGYTPDGSLDFASQSIFNVPTPGGEKVTHLAAQNGTYYLSFEANSGADAGVWIFSGDPTKGPSKTVQVPRPVSSMVVSNGTLSLLLADGSVGQFDATPAFKQIVVSAPGPLPADPATYTYATPVPVPTTVDPSAGTHFPGGALAVDPYNQNRLLVGALAANRVVQFTTGAPATNPALAAQYLYAAPVQDASAFAVTSVGGKIYLYLWNQDRLVAFPAPDA